MKFFILYLFLEVLTTVNIASSIGGFMTFLEFIFSAFVGILILANFKNNLMKNLQAVSQNQMTLRELQKQNLFALIGGILLIIPGFFTDIIGALMQFGMVMGMIVNSFGVKSTTKESTTHSYNHKESDDVIDVEIISDSNTIK